MKTNKAELYNSSLIDEILNSIDPAEANRIEKRMLLAAKIEDAMIAKGLNKSQFADLMNQKNSVITKWLSGTHNFTSDTLFDIGRVLGVNFIELESISNGLQLTFSIEAHVNIDNKTKGCEEPTVDANYFTNLYSNQRMLKGVVFNALV